MDGSGLIIEILDIYWINGEKENPEDLCLHGDVYVKIGEEVVAECYSCTVSSTALYLLKSLQSDHLPGKSPNQMLPCCGFFIIPDENEDIVSITGCSTGIDWTVLHSDGFVTLITERGNEVRLDIGTYQNIVFDFADKVEAYYKCCKDKIMPEDDFTCKGYAKFWREWHNRR